MSRPESSLGVLQKACLILRELSTPGQHRLSTIVASTGVNKATALRMLETLANEGFVHRDPATKRYELGTEALVINAAALRANRIAELARPHLEVLAARTGDAACLALAAGDRWVCVARREGDFAVRAQYVQVGRRLPMGVGSAGLAMLACRDDGEVEAFLERGAAGIARFERVTVARIRQGVAHARRHGYAVSTNVVWEGTGGIAAAVRDGDGRPVAALSVTALADRIVQRSAELGALLIEAAAACERAIAPVGALVVPGGATAEAPSAPAATTVREDPQAAGASAPPPSRPDRGESVHA